MDKYVFEDYKKECQFIDYDKACQFIIKRLDECNDIPDFAHFIICCCAIDAATNCWFGVNVKSASWWAYKEFINNFMDEKYKEVAGTITDNLRSSSVHNFMFGEILALYSNSPKKHLKNVLVDNSKIEWLIDESNHNEQYSKRIIVDVKEFHNDIKAAINKMCDAVKTKLPQFESLCYGPDKKGGYFFNYSTDKERPFVSDEEYSDYKEFQALEPGCLLPFGSKIDHITYEKCDLLHDVLNRKRCDTLQTTSKDIFVRNVHKVESHCL